MGSEGHYVAVYDVTSDKERRSVAKVLEGHGMRVQFSAFELRLTPAAKKTLVRELESLAIQTGWVALYRRSSVSHRTAIGQVPPDPLAAEHHAIVIVNHDASIREVDSVEELDMATAPPLENRVLDGKGGAPTEPDAGATSEAPDCPS